MMRGRGLFRAPLFLSVLSHLALFGFFGITMGPVLKPNNAQLNFWGELFSLDRMRRDNSVKPPNTPLISEMRSYGIKSIVPAPAEEFSSALKPQFAPPLSTEKLVALDFLKGLPQPQRRDPQIIFHPVLPYGFTIYFSDRQTAHVELEFRVSDKGDSVFVKRKISSGNLEVDLLSQRYISHYLFIQGQRFTPGVWQTVKIDLSRSEF